MRRAVEKYLETADKADGGLAAGTWQHGARRPYPLLDACCARRLSGKGKKAPNIANSLTGALFLDVAAVTLTFGHLRFCCAIWTSFIYFIERGSQFYRTRESVKMRFYAAPIWGRNRRPDRRAHTL
jgi:hypothetical protein